MSPALRRRAAFLLAGNAALLAWIWAILEEGGSFGRVIETAASSCAPTVVAGLGLTGIIASGAIDLSIGSIIAVCASVFGALVQRGAPPAVCFAACVGTAASLSILNGAASRIFGIPPIIWTLAARSFYRGLALVIASVAVPGYLGNLTIAGEDYHSPGRQHAGAILGAVLAFALAGEAWTKTPRLWLALGNSEEACRLQGLFPARISLGAFAVGGFLLGVGALVYVTQLQTIEPARVAAGFELPVIGAVVLGGTNIFGGEGWYAGTVLGAFFLHFVDQVLAYEGVSVYWRDVLVGAAIVLVIGADCLLHRRRKLIEELG